MAQMNGIAPVGAGEGWDGAAGLASPFPCRPPAPVLPFPCLLGFKNKWDEAEIAAGRCTAAPSRACALIREYEINMQQLILISCPLGCAGGFGTLRVGKNTAEGAESVDLGQVADGLNSLVDTFFFPPELVSSI